MIKDFSLNESLIQLLPEVSDWQEAITKSAAPLLEQGYIDSGYLKAMIDSVHEYGPYIVIAPMVAMPHARPETGSKKLGFSILKLEKKVCFSESEEHDVNLLVALSCENADSHIGLLQFIVEVLSDENRYKRAIEADSKEVLLELFGQE